MADDMKITIDGKEFLFDDFELGELEWLEDELGGLDEARLSSMKAAVRFVYLIKKRDDPEFTMTQARKISLKTLEGASEAEEPRPTKRASSTRGKSGAASSEQASTPASTA